MINIQKHMKVYVNIVQMNLLQIIMVIFLILLIIMPLTFSNLKKKQIGETGNDGTLNVEMILTLNYLSNIWKYLELPLFNSEISLILNWSVNFVVSSNAAVKQTTPFAITNTELYVPALPLSTQNKVELLQQLK